MTPAPGPHLSPDDVELWLNGTLDAERTRHLDLCPDCFDRAQAEREIQDLGDLFVGPSLHVAQQYARPVLGPEPPDGGLDRSAELLGLYRVQR